MKFFTEVMKRECVSAFFAVKGYAEKVLMIPAVISILMIREAVCE